MSLARIAVSVRPGPSAPTRIATRSSPTVAIASASVAAAGSGVIASRRKPLSRNIFRSAGHAAAQAYGTSSAWPIDTRTARRYSGSAQPVPNTTASTPRPAALRKIEPRFSWSLTPSSTATVRAPSSTWSTVNSAGPRRRGEHAAVEVEADHVGHHLGGRPVVGRVGRRRGRRPVRAAGDRCPAWRAAETGTPASAAPPAHPRRSPIPCRTADRACGRRC